jgi:hypothetical protein
MVEPPRPTPRQFDIGAGVGLLDKIERDRKVRTPHGPL